MIACAENPHGKVIAFEPVPRVFERLVCNINLNGYQKRCHARPHAISDITGGTTLYVPKSNLTMATLNPDGWGGVMGDPIEVFASTVDEVCGDGEGVDLVKIDVEGWEHKVLAGMSRVLREDQPVLIVECAPEGPYRIVEAILSSLHYKFFSLHLENPVRINSLTPDTIRTDHWNVLCIPETKLDML